MRVGVIAACLSCLVAAFLAPPAFAEARAQGLSGVWMGHYGYSDASPEEVPFQFEARSAGAEFAATTIEPNTFGAPNVQSLKANVAGSVAADGSVRFTKTYDGTGGVTHSVEYAGVLDAAKHCISGDWHIGGATGPFRLCAQGGLVS